MNVIIRAALIAFTVSGCAVAGMYLASRLMRLRNRPRGFGISSAFDEAVRALSREMGDRQ